MAIPIAKIREMYKRVEYKRELVEALATHFKIKELSIRNHWFSNHWAIPESKRERVVAEMKRFSKE